MQATHNYDSRRGSQNVKSKLKSNLASAIGFAQRAQCLGQFKSEEENDLMASTQAIKAKFIAQQDPVIETADGGRSLLLCRFEEAVHDEA